MENRCIFNGCNKLEGVGTRKNSSRLCPSHYQMYHRWKVKRRMAKRLRPDLDCSWCGEKFSMSALDFHHENPDDKEFEVSYAIGRGKNQKDLEREVDKCVLLCSNCHRSMENRQKEDLFLRIAGEAEKMFDYRNGIRRT